ncbi:MAG TPA: benzoate-CoA ligase family protein [Candidatus Dormibacteraeota bacterium]
MTAAEPFNSCAWLVDRHVEAGAGKRIAMVSGDVELTYAELLGAVQAAAAGIRRLGVRPEERVMLVLRDGLELATGILAAMRIGAVAMPVNPLLPPRDLVAIARDSRARIAVVDGAAQPLLAALAADALDVTAVVRVGTPAGADDASSGPLWSELVTAVGDTTVDATTTESPCFWLCTSGTTGRPKLAMHRHADIRTTYEGYASEVLGIEPVDRHLSVAPMFHAYGFGNSLTFPLAAAARAILEPTRPPTPALVAGLMERHRPTLFFAVPTFYAALLASDIPDDTLAPLRQAVSAGEALPAELFLRFRDRFGVEILDGIGSTEMTHIFLSNRRGHAVPGASGTPVRGHRVRILDDEGAAVPAGSPGQLWVSGSAAATGYWCRSEDTRRTFVGDWVATGDLYWVDADGVHRHLGRRDDMLKVGGEWVSPAEVESVLLGLGGVAEVAVVGATGADGLMRAVAFAVPLPGTLLDVDDVLARCRSELAGYKRPRRLLVVDTLPKTATGKVIRADLRREAALALREPG